jgi:cobalt-zinc-cadmium efflux system outer membrane protein
MLINRLAQGICIMTCVCLTQPANTYAQATGYGAPADTIRVTMPAAEKMFLDKNLQLLAEHYNIQSSQALVEQARKWDNPVLNTDQNVYSGNKFFQHGTDANGNPNGQFYVQVQQLIKTAGKRGKQIDLAKTNSNLAEWQFKSVMLNLRAELIKDFYTVDQLMSKAQLYDENMQRLEKLLSSREAELKAGNIAQKEYLRVQALIISLQNDVTENEKDISDAESELKTLLAVTGNTFILPVLPQGELVNAPLVSVLQLVDSAKRNNTDYQQQIYQLQYTQQNLRLQKALAVPDLTLGPNFDQNSNYTPNYVGLGISLPIPIFDRNRGNIKSAQYQVKQGESLMSLADQKLQNDVMNAYQKLLYTIQLSSKTNTQFYTEYNKLQKNIVDSYNERQIGLIEFLEYFKDYQDIKEQQLLQVYNLRMAKEELNDVVGMDIVK